MEAHVQQHHSAEREEQAGAQGRRAAAPAPARGQPPPPQQQQPVEPARDAKKRRVSEDGTAPKGSERRTSSGNEWLRAWAWKREHRPDKVRFDRPYLHPFQPPGAEAEVKLTIHQQRFKAEGFASTVWDSSIVLAKMFERHAARFAGKRCLDLSAGCGLPGVVLSKLGARVTATDLAPNLALLEKNAKANGCDIEVREHTWGEDAAALRPPFDVVALCDLMYVVEAVGALVASLVALCGPETEVYVAHGRNRQAEPDFLRAAAPHFTVEAVPREELDATYQCADVDVLRLRLRPGGAAAAGGAGAAAVEAAAGGAGAAAAVVDGAGACIEGLNGAEK